MISADDSSANAFAPYANSYFPAAHPRGGRQGRMQFAARHDADAPSRNAAARLRAALANTNPWLKERCAEYTTRGARRARARSQTRLATIKATRSAEKHQVGRLFRERRAGRGLRGDESATHIPVTAERR